PPVARYGAAATVQPEPPPPRAGRGGPRDPRGGDAMAHERAGQPARPSDLVDVARLVTAYYTLHPDPAVPEQRVTFGTSGHRGSSLTASFNEDHILATSQAICEYRALRGVT